jgi:hypothetical protein
MRPYLTVGLSRALPADGCRGTGSPLPVPAKLGRVKEFGVHNGLRRGKTLPALEKTVSKRVEAVAVSLTPVS